jgi:7-keto-8-aminopelargonate synthetase-like enzyme
LSTTGRIAPTHLIHKIERSIRGAIDAGVVWNTVDAVKYDGRTVVIGGQSLLNFGGCSYLGLELRPELHAGTIEALARYGTQFSFSRAYLECPLYQTLETQLQRICGGFPLVAATTSLGHISALPVLIAPEDAVIIDLSAHASVHTALGLVRGAAVTRVRHSNLADVSRKLERLTRTHARVWYLLDGLYSMLGDLAPLDGIAKLLEQYPQLHLYVDDAHATSWCGAHGRGYALSVLPDTSRVVVTLSLNKAFSAAGGVIVLPDEASRTRVRMCGGPMVFSGPIQPPMLGAAVASAQLHLDGSFEALQQQLMKRIDQVLALARSSGVELASYDRTPIFFMPCGTAHRAFGLVHKLRAHGIYACASVFPAVAEDQAGIRFTVSLHNQEQDIVQLMAAFVEGVHKAA